MERNVIAKNTSIIGNVKSEGDFRIDGILEGSLQTNGRVIIGVEGLFKGEIKATDVDIEGEFSGNLLVEKILAIKTPAKISGDVVVGKLSIEPGAIFNATCVMKGTEREKKKEVDKPKPIKRPINKALRLSVAGLQMGLTIYLGFLAGKWLDAKFEITYLTGIITLLAIFLAMLSLIKQANKINE